MLDFARAGAAVGATSATLEKTRILGGYFRTLDEDDLKRAAVYMSGRAFPPSQRRTLGLGWSTLSKVVSSVSRRDEAELGEIFRKHSDLGDWAAEALDGSTQPAPVSLQDVEATLEAIRSAGGNTKVAPLEAVARRAFFARPERNHGGISRAHRGRAIAWTRRPLRRGGAGPSGWTRTAVLRAAAPPGPQEGRCRP